MTLLIAQIAEIINSICCDIDRYIPCIARIPGSLSPIIRVRKYFILTTVFGHLTIENGQ